MGEPDSENVDTLDLGPMFTGATCLFNCEVATILENEKKDKMMRNPDDVPNANLEAALSYTMRLSRIKNASALSEVRQYMESKSFEQYEIASVLNLCPTTAEEAKAVIPSLQQRFDDDELEQVLQEIATYRDAETISTAVKGDVETS